MNATNKPTEWLESQPNFWRGRALVRRPGPDIDVWSEEALRGHQLAGQYELMAEQCETITRDAGRQS
jgi:hypothetical protein